MDLQLEIQQVVISKRRAVHVQLKAGALSSGHQAKPVAEHVYRQGGLLLVGPTLSQPSSCDAALNSVVFNNYAPVNSVEIWAKPEFSKRAFGSVFVLRRQIFHGLTGHRAPANPLVLFVRTFVGMILQYSGDCEADQSVVFIELYNLSGRFAPLDRWRWHGSAVP